MRTDNVAVQSAVQSAKQSSPGAASGLCLVTAPPRRVYSSGCNAHVADAVAPALDNSWQAHPYHAGKAMPAMHQSSLAHWVCQPPMPAGVANLQVGLASVLDPLCSIALVHNSTPVMLGLRWKSL